MAQRVKVQLIDDLTGDEAEETVKFGIDGITYEIDLTAENARKLREQLNPYLEKGRKARGRSAAQPRPRTSDRENTQRIRQWAEKHGYHPSSRGRISKNILEAYQAANS